mmetsp:Transcript_44215/g.103706  ORF Transcript_44215/g.103706 Transcript_44215/m.103706 type:complete len:102 (+) Transcript_44215:144-449(+)
MAAHQLHESTKHHEAAEELPNYLSNAPPRPRPPKKAPGKKAYTLDDVLGIGKTSVWSLSLSEEFRTLISFECEVPRSHRLARAFLRFFSRSPRAAPFPVTS